MAPVALVLMQGCARLDVAHFQKHPTPMVVQLEVPEGVSKDLQDEYAAAMRARLAMCTTVVADGVQPPVGASMLRVIIHDRDTSKGASPGAVGAATGIAVGALALLAGERHSALDGVFWGVWAGTQAAEARRLELQRMGYRAPRLYVQVEMRDGIAPSPLLAFKLGPGEIIEAMTALPEGQRADENRQLEVEAKALAKVVVNRIQQEMGWLALPEPRWFEGYRSEPIPSPFLP